MDGNEQQSVGSTVEWQVYQRPSIEDVVQESSITTHVAPGPVAGRPGTIVHRFELDPRARYANGEYVVGRVEVYGRHAEPGDTPAEQWPDPPGSTRWYTFSLYVPPGWQTTTGKEWVVLTQWKGFKGGSPPLSIETKRQQLRLGGPRTNAGDIAGDGLLGDLVPGEWTTLTVGIHFSTSKDEGWVEVDRDGETVVPKTSVATMDVINGKPDPIYLKQGLYQDASWTATHILYASEVTVTDTKPAYQPFEE